MHLCGCRGLLNHNGGIGGSCGIYGLIRPIVRLRWGVAWLRLVARLWRVAGLRLVRRWCGHHWITASRQNTAQTARERGECTGLTSFWLNPLRACARGSQLVSRSHTLSKTGRVCLASTTHARGMSGMFGLRNILHNKLRLLTCYTNHDVTAPALTKLL